MPFLLLIFFGIYGWIEFEAFIAIGNAVGGLATFLGIFVTAFIGIALMKRQGKWVLKQWQSSVSEGEMNTSTLASGASLVLGAVLMLLPGYVTDFVGLLCFTPILRVLIGQAFLSRLVTSVFASVLSSSFSTRFSKAGGFSPYDQTNSEPDRPTSYARHHPLGSDVIEGQFESKEDSKN